MIVNREESVLGNGSRELRAAPRHRKSRTTHIQDKLHNDPPKGEMKLTVPPVDLVNKNPLGYRLGETNQRGQRLTHDIGFLVKTL